MVNGLGKSKEIFKNLDVNLSVESMQHIYLQARENEPNSSDFVLKMEVRRLLKPCRQVIDLRGKVDGICERYEYEDINHFMDPVAAQVFEKQLGVFGDFTIGVFEAVHKTENNFRVRYEKSVVEAQESFKAGKSPALAQQSVETQSAPQISYLVPSYCFADIDRRKEERMNFFCKVELRSDCNEVFEARSLDLSLHGIRVRTNSEMQFSVGDVFQLYYTGLENKYVLNDVNGERYQVVNIIRHDDERQIGLKRIQVTLYDKVTVFLRDLIRTLKPVRKVNVSNSLRSLNIKGLEQYFIKGSKSFPVFIVHSKGEFYPRYALSNEVSAKSLCYWSNKQQQHCLSVLLSQERLSYIIERGITELYAYAFNTTSKDDVVFYTAMDYELKDNELLRSSFLAYATRQASWRVYKLQVKEISEQQSYRPLTTPQAKKEMEEGKIPISVRALKVVRALSHMVLMTDITDETQVLAYHRHKVSQKHYKALLRFRQAEPDESKSFSMIQLNNLRGDIKQTRSPFPVRTNVILEKDGVKQDGVTDLVTPYLIRVGLREGLPWQEGEVLKITFPELKTRSKHHQMVDLPFEVVDIGAGGKFVSLKPFKKRDSDIHTAEHFFINYSRTVAEKHLNNPPSKIEDLPDALRNLYVNNALNFGLYFKLHGKYRLPAAMSRPVIPTRIATLFNLGIEADRTSNVQNMYTLFSDGEYEQHFVTEILKMMPSKGKPELREGVMKEIFIAYHPDASSLEKMVTSKPSEDFASNMERQDYIATCLARGIFFSVTVWFSQSADIDWEFLKEERNYVRKNASEELTQFENELKKIIGVGEVIDTTDEVMRRYGFSEEEILLNRKPSE
ncbi:PilZ domain-containing protein [Paraneptunicella aestuarii]|uniref:PilZ domain-containing protein n=1 Tax=Paraneptunicella aestuarii TaxID=2831148 RepID=UPI001E450CB3|nr:PilZ domain-containing protein [Paraneptunicella aestuarii]UAA40224.1 PilZ domain-containing protein [Paraneptunicella aestuarii]